MRVGILFSGGKDSSYAAWLARERGYEISCLISIESSNKDSFMFHTPSINQVKKQAEKMSLPLILVKSAGEKEKELEDLEDAIKKAVKEYNIEGVVTGAVESVYQASRVQVICNKIGIECFNPLWQKNAEEHWREMIKQGFSVILVSVAADGLGKNWLGKEITNKSLEELIKLSKKYKFHLAFEGGEAETFVLNCPLFSSALKIKSFKDFGSGNSWRQEIEVG